MTTQDVRKAIEERSLPISVAEKYLKLYVADISWQEHIATLWKNASKNKSEDLAKEHVKKAVSCAVLLPYVEKTPIPDPPSNLLFWCTGWQQFNTVDWFTTFLDILKEDLIIVEKRNELIKLGVIDRIDVTPITRQAFNWLYEKAVDSAGLSEANQKDIKVKFTNLVKAYGGATICNIFVNHKSNIAKVLNWRSGYFFEKEIHKVYSLDQIKKIKSTEISKINKNYIKKIESSIGEKNDRQYSF